MLEVIILFILICIVFVQAFTIKVFTERIKKLEKFSYSKTLNKTKYSYIEGDIDLIHQGKKIRLKAYIYPTKME